MLRELKNNILDSFLSILLYLLRRYLGERQLQKASCFAPFTQKLGVRLSKLTHKRGRRSAKSIEIRSQWQAARKFVQDQAFFDRLKGESVCRSTSSDVADYLAEAFGQPLPEAIPNVEHGSVLTDSRGEGAFQLQITCPAIAD